MRILLVRLRLIGDVVFTTPAVQAIRRRFPDAHLAYLVEPEAAPVVLSSPALSEIIVAGRARGLDRLREDARLALRLRRAHYDVVIDFHGGPRAQLLTLATGAPIRIGYELAGGPARGRVYTHRAVRPRELRRRHSVENQWDLLPLLDPAFAGGPDRHRDPVVMAEDRAAGERASSKLSAAGVSGEHQLIVAHVSAGNPFRRWPAASFTDALVALAERDSRRRILLTSGPSDARARDFVGDSVRARLGPKGEQVVRCDELGLAELRAVISRAALFIGGDSGPLHIAATTATPIVGIYGPTLPVRSSPWRNPALVTEDADVGTLPCRPCDQRVCEPGDFRCLTRLTGHTVVAASERALERAAGTRLEQASFRLERLA